MADGAFLSPEEQSLLRMVREAGSPQAAGEAIIHRLEALEAQVAELEAYLSHQAAVQAAEERDQESALETEAVDLQAEPEP